MKRIAYELYDANLSIRENAQELGCSEAALRKHLKNTGIDRRYDAYYVRWRKIKDFFEANPSATLAQANQELGYSPHTIRKYKSISEQELEEAFRDTIKVSNFDIRNKNSIKTISYDQTEILAWIMRLYNNRLPFDCDLTASKCIFWKSLPKPEHLFDVNPQIEGVQHLSEADNLKDCSFNSVVFDLPFLVSKGAMSKIKERFTYFESVDEIYKANDEMLKRSYRLLKEQGLLVVKTMDICHGNKQIWISDYVIKKAEELGLELIEKFILLSNLRLFARTRQQKVARKYHSYFFVFRKKTTQIQVRPIKAMLLDFDHTLFDTRADEEVRKNTTNKDWDVIYSKIPEYQLYNGWREVFERAKTKGVKIAIISTAKKDLIQKTLDYFGLQCDIIVGWQRCYQKPHPHLVEMALNKLQVSKDYVISIGDSVVDMEMSQNGGVRFIGALWDSQESNDLKIGDVICSPKDILGFI